MNKKLFRPDRKPNGLQIFDCVSFFKCDQHKVDDGTYEFRHT